MLNTKKLFGSILLSAMVFMPVVQAFADFNPNKLIEDANFSDVQTFGSAAGIQKFLVSKGSPLANTDPNFLLTLKEPQDVGVKTALSDPEPNLPRLRTAAELIWDASVKTGLNPQVIIVTLQKEQTLITGSFSGSSLQRALDHALGFGCPDSGGCDSLFVGFYAQLFGGLDSQGNRYIGAPGSLMRSFSTPGGRGPAIDATGSTFGGTAVRTSRVGDTILVQNTLGGPQNPQPTQSVTLQNSATAALYRYTPHVYNGNYNFWKFYDQWFHYPNGTLLKLATDNTTYIISDGLRSVIPGFVIQSRGLNAGSTITVSPTELSGIDQGPIMGPADNVIIKVDTDPANKLYVFQNNQKHPVSQFVLTQRGLKPTSALTVSQADADLFQTASLLTPKEGTLIKGAADPAVYVIANQKKMTLSAFTFRQYGYSFRNVVSLPQDEVSQYDAGGFLLPKNGTLVKNPGNPTVMLVQNGLLKPISGTVFKLQRFSFRNVVTLSSDELANASLGSFVAPPDGTYFKTPEGAVYLYKSGSKHYVSYFVFKQRRISPVDLSSIEAMMLNDGLPVPPKDGTVIKGDNSATIYVIQNGLKVALDFNTWKRKYRMAKPTVLPQGEVDSYPAPGDIQQ